MLSPVLDALACRPIFLIPDAWPRSCSATVHARFARDAASGKAAVGRNQGATVNDADASSSQPPAWLSARGAAAEQSASRRRAFSRATSSRDRLQRTTTATHPTSPSGRYLRTLSQAKDVSVFIRWRTGERRALSFDGLPDNAFARAGMRLAIRCHSSAIAPAKYGSTFKVACPSFARTIVWLEAAAARIHH